MDDNIAVLLDKAYYVRSKIGNYPLSHNILPVPNGMSAVILELLQFTKLPHYANINSTANNYNHV